MHLMISNGKHLHGTGRNGKRTSVTAENARVRRESRQMRGTEGVRGGNRSREEFQGRSVGTEVMNRLIGEASRARRPVCLDVVKTNTALRLYERLGFRTTGEEVANFI
jgi:GNAT superfamily N-acetyltransferase